MIVFWCLCALSAVIAKPSIRRSIYLLNANGASYADCSLPGFRRYADAYALPLHVLDESALQARRRRRSQLAELLTSKNSQPSPPQQQQQKQLVGISAFERLNLSDAHFAKLDVFADALERGYDEILYVDIDVVVNERADVPDVFDAAALDERLPSIAMYSQGAPKGEIVDAIRRINPRVVGVDVAGTREYWNSGVMVVNRRAMLTLKALIELLVVQYVNRGERLEQLPFFDQGFLNAVLWDRDRLFGRDAGNSSSIVVRRLSFAWNASHSKYFYHHGNRFWLNESSEFLSGRRKFTPYFYHFMGCAGRSMTPEEGIDCKRKRMQEFVSKEFNIDC